MSTSSTTMGALTPPEQNALLMLEGTIKSLITSGLVVPQEEWKLSEGAYWGVGEGAAEAVSNSEVKEGDSAAAVAAAAAAAPPLIRWAIDRISISCAPNPKPSNLDAQIGTPNNAPEELPIRNPKP
jgi:hypothetical protein